MDTGRGYGKKRQKDRRWCRKKKGKMAIVFRLQLKKDLFP
jgi:hypothetical protein